MPRRKKISFNAIRKVSKKVNVEFTTSDGKDVSFKATKKIPKKVKVEFYAKKRKK